MMLSRPAVANGKIKSQVLYCQNASAAVYDLLVSD